MQKIIIIFLLLIYLTGCSVSKFSVQNNSEEQNIDTDNLDLQEIKKKNLTSIDFFIKKAEVEILDQGEKQKFVASCKFRSPDSFMISLRSTTGIEAARMFLSKDTVLINDRINRTFYFGSNTATKKKYGFSSEILPILFGDIITNIKTELSLYNCNKGVSAVETFFDGYKISYSINCKNKKSFSVTVTKDIDTKPFYIKYEDFGRLEDVSFARKTSIRGLNDFDIINVKISKIEIPWEGTMKFIPGDNYEQIEIR